MKSDNEAKYDGKDPMAAVNLLKTWRREAESLQCREWLEGKEAKSSDALKKEYELRSNKGEKADQYALLKAEEMERHKRESMFKMEVSIRKSLSAEVIDTVEMLAGTNKEDLTTPAPLFYKIFTDRYVRMSDFQLRKLRNELYSPYDDAISITEFARRKMKIWNALDLFDSSNGMSEENRVMLVVDALCDHFLTGSGKEHAVVFNIWRSKKLPTSLRELISELDRAVEERLLPDRAHIPTVFLAKKPAYDLEKHREFFDNKCAEVRKMAQGRDPDSQCILPRHKHKLKDCPFFIGKFIPKVNSEA